MPRIKLELNRRYLTNSGLIAGPFWLDSRGVNFFGKAGFGEERLSVSYDGYGNYRATSIERQENPGIDTQLRIVSEFIEPQPIPAPMLAESSTAT